jgi:hypothetical protein
MLEADNRKRTLSELVRRFQGMESQIALNEGVLLMDHMAQILSFVLMEHPEKFGSVAEFVRQMTGADPKDCLQNYLSNILFEVVIQLGDPVATKRDRAIAALSKINELLNSPLEEPTKALPGNNPLCFTNSLQSF